MSKSIAGDNVCMYAVSTPERLDAPGSSPVTFTFAASDMLAAAADAYDELDFIRPLVDRGMEVLDACLLYNACNKDIDTAMLAHALWVGLFAGTATAPDSPAAMLARLRDDPRRLDNLALLLRNELQIGE